MNIRCAASTLLFCMIALVQGLSAQSGKFAGMKKKVIHTEKAPQPIGPYSQAMRAGDFIFVSGQIPLDPATGNMVEGDIQAQTRQVMENIKAILKEGGSDFSSVIKSSIFLKDMGDFPAVNEVYGSYLQEPYPARETIQVAKLPKDAMVEISVIAIRN